MAARLSRSTEIWTLARDLRLKVKTDLTDAIREYCEKRVAHIIHVVTDCSSKPVLQDPIKDPARLPWHEVTKVAHYYLSVDAMTQPMEVHEEPAPYGGDKGRRLE
jgi:hypothetical protein